MRDIVLLALGLGYPALALWQIAAGKLRDRADVVISLGSGVVLLLFVRAVADWAAVPAWTWLVGLGLLVVATVLAGRAWPGLPTLRPGHPVRRAVSVAVQVLVAAGLVVVLL